MAANAHTQINIVVNGRSKKIDSDILSYEAVVALAFDPVPTGDTVDFTVSFHNDANHNDGTLRPGQTVTVRNGTVINVTQTDKS